METVWEFFYISLNKNSVPGDKSALSPNGIRIGTSPMTTRGMERWDLLAGWLLEAVKICQRRSMEYGKKMVDFKRDIEADEEILKLREKVRKYASSLEYYEWKTKACLYCERVSVVKAVSRVKPNEPR